MKLKYIIVAENIYTDNEGRLNINQAYDIIYASSFPAIHPKISIVTRWMFEKKDNKKLTYKQKIKIVNSKNNKVVLETDEFGLRANEKNNKGLVFISNITNIELDTSGIYKIFVYMNGKLEKETAAIDVKKLEN